MQFCPISDKVHRADERSTSNCLDKRHVWRIWLMRWRPSSCRWTTSIRRPETRFNSGSNASHPKNRIYSLLTTVTDERRKGREERCRDVVQGVCQLLPENILRRLRAVCVETSRLWTQAATKRIKYVAELKDTESSEQWSYELMNHEGVDQ